jgi:hypothetical protein
MFGKNWLLSNFVFQKRSRWSTKCNCIRSYGFAWAMRHRRIELPLRYVTNERRWLHTQLTRGGVWYTRAIILASQGSNLIHKPLPFCHGKWKICHSCYAYVAWVNYTLFRRPEKCKYTHCHLLLIRWDYGKPLLESIDDCNKQGRVWDARRHCWEPFSRWGGSASMVEAQCEPAAALLLRPPSRLPLQGNYCRKQKHKLITGFLNDENGR